MKKIIVQTKHKFTGMGQFGVALFVVAPIVTAIATPALLNELGRTYGSNPLVPALFLGLAGIGATISIPMMLIGRASLHLAETIEGSEKADEIWEGWSASNRE